MFDLSVGKKPVPYIACSRTSTGGRIEREARLDEPVNREPEDRLLEQRGVADDSSRTESRRGAPRAPSRSGRARGGRGVFELRRLPPAANLDGVVLGVAVGTSGCGGLGSSSSAASRSAAADGQLLLGLPRAPP
jgi:hypothetical protein